MAALSDSAMTRMCAGSAGPEIRDLLGHLSDKWTLLVIGMLDAGPVRYTELKNRVPGISQRMLTLTLKKLERDGMVHRESYPEVPPRVEYEVTALGRTMIAPALAFAEWAHEYAPEILAARDRYDEAVDDANSTPALAKRAVMTATASALSSTR